ncbi:phosphatase PAP2 family protein [Candidatus Woesearchaeota archaeon]|jgi:membrane-associated phospholipid phosphatase|nr:phosphatase PAP2 family protein [Candidatus Woesearchaeota archaeon]MBT4151229.1 phosphatase PAP2 family protein [Candidatus Woesearchaeota archaeon]MBT4434532.1 phosphatase PAP2 family protein [Candidatus Woesearchaeota archaeon]
MNKVTRNTLIGIIILIVSFLLDSILLSFNPQIISLNPLFMFLGGKIGLGIFVILITLFLTQKKKIISFWFSVTIGVVISYALKFLIQRPRPDLFPLIVKTSASFPSTHATIAAIGGFFSWKLKNQYMKWIGVVLSFLVALTGYYNSVHYASDVVAGVLIGLLISWYVIKKKII